ncbi:unnamed protein product [Vicia faba]|uniref:Secreted protein n=1 Tax=Vicia faba TaxID=3906 RepID=A0AAV1B766_VICFA|nr:unnamed protein product [Vicia faba]
MVKSFTALLASVGSGGVVVGSGGRCGDGESLMVLESLTVLAATLWVVAPVGGGEVTEGVPVSDDGSKRREYLGSRWECLFGSMSSAEVRRQRVSVGGYVKQKACGCCGRLREEEDEWW